MMPSTTSAAVVMFSYQDPKLGQVNMSVFVPSYLLDSAEGLSALFTKVRSAALGHVVGDNLDDTRWTSWGIVSIKDTVGYVVINDDWPE